MLTTICPSEKFAGTPPRFFSPVDSGDSLYEEPLPSVALSDESRQPAKLGSLHTEVEIGEAMFSTVLETFRLLSRSEKRVFVGLTIARVATQFLDVLAIASVGVLAGLLASDWGENTSAVFLGMSFDLSLSDDLIVVVWTCAILFFSKSLISVLLLHASSMFMAGVEARNSGQIADFVFSGDLPRLLESSRGDVQWSVHGSVRMAMGILETAATMAAELALFIFVFGLFLLVDAPAALTITALFAALLITYQLSIGGVLKRLGGRSAKNSIVVGDSILDLFNTFRETSVSGTREYFLGLFRQTCARLAVDGARIRVLMGVPRYLLETLLIVCISGLVAWEFRLGLSPEGLTVAAVFLAGGFRMAASALPLQNSFASIRSNAPLAQRAQMLLARMEKESATPRNKDRFRKPSAQISPTQASQNGSREPGFSARLTNVTFAYPAAKHPAVVDINLEMQPGEVVALVGPSGAGKTTIADLLLGLLEPLSGEINIDGAEPDRAMALRTGAVAYVPQRPGVVSGTIAENVALGVPSGKIDFDRVRTVLEDVELGVWVRELERDVGTSLGAQGEALSGGQLQRLGLARALYHHPRLLVLDEATSALDATTEEGVAKNLFNAGNTFTTLIIAHRLNTVKKADTVYVVEAGKIVASGPFKRLAVEVPLLREYVRLSSLGT